MISGDRKKHIFAVAEFLKNYAISKNMKSSKIEDLYLLGILHDIGYEFAEEKDYKKHNFIGGEILKNQGYQYWKVVYFHGVVNPPYESNFLDLLNWADMHINSEGNYVSFEERLNEISEKYNVPIKQLDSYLIIEKLKQKGFK